MQPNPHERALAVFDAFLRNARDAPGGAPTAPDAPPEREERTDPSMVAARDDDVPTNVATSVPPPSDFDDGPTSMSTAASATADTDAEWDEPTRMRTADAPGSRAREAAPIARAAPESSIIVDDESLTEPLGTDLLQVGGQPDARVDTFVAEMTTLIKYGHASQVAREIQLWFRAYPDDLRAHFHLLEFECARVDASSGLDRMFALASRALDRGDVAVAENVLRFVDREAPNDLRRNALRDRFTRQ